MHLTKLKNLKSLKIGPLRWSLKDEHVQSLRLNCKKLEELDFPTISSICLSNFEEFCKGLKSSLRKLSFRCYYDFNWTFQP